jgi:hypothetical protein
MADAGELLREAQYAFHNVSHGNSPDNRRNTAHAKSLARKIIRKFPTSMEAGQAQQILERLDPDSATLSIQRGPEHQFKQIDRHEQIEQHHRLADSSPSIGGRKRPVNRDWKKLLQALTHLKSFERNLLLVGAFFLVTLMPFAALTIAATIIFLAGPFEKYHPQGTQDVLDKFYAQTDAWIAKRRTK